nr:hypothetical protein [Tanacetum cinerariifolium]
VTGTWINMNMGNSSTNQSKVIRCYKYRSEGHMERQCTQTKRQKNSEWSKEKILLAQALESLMTLDEEQLSFLADLRDIVDSGPDTQTSPTIAIF